MILPLFSQINPNNMFQLIYHISSLYPVYIQSISSLYPVYIPLTIDLPVFTTFFSSEFLWNAAELTISASSGEVGLGERELRPLSCGNGSRHGMPIFLHNISQHNQHMSLMFIDVYCCICCKKKIPSSISSSHLNSPSRYFQCSIAKDIGKAQQPPVGWRFPWQPAQPFVPPSACAGRDGLPWHFGWVFTSYNSHLTSFNNLTSKKWWN